MSDERVHMGLVQSELLDLVFLYSYPVTLFLKLSVKDLESYNQVTKQDWHVFALSIIGMGLLLFLKALICSIQQFNNCPMPSAH